MGEIVLRCCRGEPDVDYFAFRPASARAGARVVVAVHGISEHAAGHARALSHLAERHGVIVVAPHFNQPDFRDYQRLGRLGRGARADRALERVLDELSLSTGASTERFFLFGFSGGAQFAHRYVMAHPRRVVSAALASAGWYTWPDRKQAYPYGLKRIRRLHDLEFEPDAFLRVPILLTVGDQDTERDPALRTSEALDRQQGRNRAERAAGWARAMKRAALERGLPANVTLKTIPEADHSFPNCIALGLGELVFEHFFAERRASRPRERAENGR
ncbi:MAG: hypothetical protein QNK04_31415 [Myxococcota bacterium]|nr:hypothetical protein [Myxococcota bacterium]